MKKALITGITGQDGAYLAELLLKKGYEVHGIKRRISIFNTDRIDHIYQDPHIENQKFKLHYGDLTDSTNLIRIVEDVKPDEIYNLAAMSHVHVSFEIPEYTGNVDALGTLRLLEAVRLLNRIDKTRIYQASTSELYGKVQEIPQSETTPFYPRSPYGVAKLYGFWITKNYREAYNMYACNGILFNHESPIRGETFVTRKITRAASKIALGLQDKFYLGNLNSKRDWGHAKDFVRAMYLILQQDVAEDYVVATGETHEIREFVAKTFKWFGVELEFKGSGVDETAVIASVDSNRLAELKIDPKVLFVGKEVLAVDPRYFRPTEVDLLIGDSSKARKNLGWVPEFTFDDLVVDMISADFELMKKEEYLKEGGYKPMSYFE